VNVKNSFEGRSVHNMINTLGVLSMVILMIFLAGCISSSKSYNAGKNIVYNGSMYNISNVKTVNSKVEGQLPNGDVKNMKGMDKKSVEALLSQSSPIMVTTALDLDGDDMVYERRSVTKYSEYSKMIKNFESAGKKITKFMGDKKATQLKLK
jgi:hypothetical protein